MISDIRKAVGLLLHSLKSYRAPESKRSRVEAIEVNHIDKTIGNPQIREINISRSAYALRFLRYTDYVLVIFCGTWLAKILSLYIIALEIKSIYGLIIDLIAVAILSFCIYTGCRHVGAIDPGVWRAYTIAFPMLLLLCIVIISINLLGISAGGHLNLQTISGVITPLWIAISALFGFASVLLLRRMHVASFSVPLVRLLSNLRRYRGGKALRATMVQRVNAPFGIFLGVLGGTLVFSIAIIPLPENQKIANNIM